MEILVLIILTLLNSFFALSEISIISVKKSRIAQKAQGGSKNAKIIMDLLSQPEDFLSAIQVGITLIGIVSGAYGGAALSDDVQPLISQVSFLQPYAEALSITIVIGLITYFSIVIGELIPKTIAMGNADKIALFVAPIIKGFTTLTLPLVKLLSGSTNLVVRLLGIKETAEDKLSEEELRQIIKTAGKQGVLAKEESELHQNIFNYAGQKARDLKTHRKDVEWIDINAPEENIKEKIRKSVHSKFLVSNGVVDNVIGILNSKDYYENMLNPRHSLTDVLKKPIFVSETMLANAVLNLFKKHKQYLGVVVDEFGSVEGIITLHDILEAIVGNLPDTDESNEPAMIKRDNGSYLVKGSTLIQELNKELKREFIQRNNEYLTLAGFIIHYLGRLPATAEKFVYNGVEFEIVDMDGIKIDKVIIKRLSENATKP
ncbi:hemolysin family protein [Adhaeribacter rhizoryzae]|uniref:HlyC/CorC family transporter n=1 Tax=Adhaeribacter rhizoryzae TaxID=2607907 RepID=A0A5M6DSS7_9BACT|nr:hemolysin family protein [Adhaeribacter rhizoryzae]KAA5549180.1 HlyC/CorC family transporter [Adhaeribacter rhizoryzae]